jgi:hypothetical protein
MDNFLLNCQLFYISVMPFFLVNIQFLIVDEKISLSQHDKHQNYQLKTLRFFKN